eukprot:TRINITY_DN20673_c0_g1_i1.p1 TRINITY_DN20673_c0_g1~~TRINITY_DN20673_c0_g1_i1.p1  ORF type:complete len:207 (+),score=37.29 TRINITY_DN20673_c0_g1_i1:33-653(+)
MAATLSAQDLRIVELGELSIQSFKVVGDQQSILDYAQAHPPRVAGEWSAMYLQLNEPHALGTVPYRWDMGYEAANLLGIAFKKLSVVLVDSDWMPDGSLDGDEKARVLKTVLDIPEDCRLMEGLELKRQALLCRETEDQWELVVPVGILQGANIQEEVLLELRPNAYGATGHCRSHGEDCWRRFDETEALRDVPPPQWIVDALSRA